MKFKIKIQFYDGHIQSWEGVPDYFLLHEDLEKCEIKSFEISQIPYQK